MTKFHDFLIGFMEGKAKFIKEDIGWDIYFNDQDRFSILSWSKKEAKRVCKILINHIFKSYNNLSFKTCPFCIKNYNNNWLECPNCDYQITHAMCSLPSSDYQKIASTRIKLPDNFCKDLINHLNKELKIFKIRRKK